MHRYMTIHMLLFHNVPAVRRLSKQDASTLLTRFYACRTIQRFVRRRLARSYNGAVAEAPKTRDTDASMARAMRHILACTVAAVVAPASTLDTVAYAADIKRLVARLHSLSPSTALATRRRWVDAMCRAQQGTIQHGARLDAVMCALLNARPKLRRPFVCGA
jgi:hypothetical protein